MHYRQGKTVTSQWKNLVDTIEINTICCQSCWYCAPLMRRVRHPHRWYFLPKTKNSSPIWEKHQTNSNRGTIYKTATQSSSNPCRSWKTREAWDMVTAEKSPRAVWLLNRVLGSMRTLMEKRWNPSKACSYVTCSVPACTSLWQGSLVT